jgi:serine/threonine-protein kinase
VAQAAVAYLQSQGIFGEMKNYVVKNRIGQGCRSEVFLAREKDQGRKVALKIYRAPFQEVREGDIPMGGIFNELRFQAVMNDDAIVRLLRCGLMAGSTPYLAFEYMSEGTLADWVKGLSLSDDRSVTVPLLMVERLLQVAAFVHTSGIIHGDISLQNLLVGSQGQIKFADFAMARRLEERPYHFETIIRKDDSPEGLAYDVFQLGKVLYQIFTRHPHEISDRAIQRLPAPSQRRPDLQIPIWIGELIRKCLQPNPAEHFPNAGAMRAFFQSHK